MTDSQKRERTLRSLASRAGCELKFSADGQKRIAVFIPGFRGYGASIDMTRAIDSHLKTGTPGTAEIVAEAIEYAEATNYHPGWNYVMESMTAAEVARRERLALRRTLNLRGMIVGK